MKRFIFLSAFLTFSYLAYTQDFLTFNQERRKIDRLGMTTLTTWSALNLVIGSYGMIKYDGTTKYFHQMNAMWSGFNLCLSVPGLIKSYHRNSDNLSAEQTLKTQVKTEKIYLFNAALDIAYITGGLLLKERSKWDIQNSDRLNGLGNGVLLQSGFLFVFDAFMYFSHNHHKQKLFSQLDLGMTNLGPSLLWHLN